MITLIGDVGLRSEQDRLAEGYPRRRLACGLAGNLAGDGAAPDLVRMEDLALDQEPWLSLQIKHPDNYQHAEKIVDDPFVVPRMTQRPEIKVGVMGFPHRANVELGEKIAADIVNYAAGRIKDD